MSAFACSKAEVPLEAFILSKKCVDDTFPNKVNLSVGVYRTEKDEPWVLPVVRNVEKLLADDESLDKDYLPVLGLEKFSKAATELLLGNDSQALLENRAFGVHTLSGSGALRVAAEFLGNKQKYEVFYVSTPSYENHNLIFKSSGFKEGRTYRYWDKDARKFDIEGMLEDLRRAPERSAVILHACAHNPTGCDPTKEQWKRIVDVLEERKLFPVLDCAYQGFASGDFDDDAWSVRYFVSRGLEFFCCQSFSKNFGIYAERTGNLVSVVNNTDVIPNLRSQLTLIVRGMYSNPPCHGARVVAHILTNPELFEEWKVCIKIMSSRIIEMRRRLREALERLGTPGTWEHITTQIGMFSYTGLSEPQCLHMVFHYHIYMLRSGRISMCGLNETNIDYVARAIYETITGLPASK